MVIATDPGSPDRPNEDFAAAAPGAAVLLDGATAPADVDTGCIHGVAWYAQTLGTALLAGITAVPHVPLQQALAAAAADVRAQHEHTCDLTKRKTPGATVTALRAEPGGISYLALSDSSIAADYGDGRPPRVITDSHWAIRANPQVAMAARIGILTRAGLRGIALLSDGATRIADCYDLIGWPELLGVIRDDGPGAVISRVRAAEAGDPDGARWPRRKIRDDATVLWWPAPGGPGC
ncbi:MAG TPA: protein phosphatase 2C domain-containing protein [Streptosporangiaceae bacterium]|nr:protein phosphatase 2C domain-containing protein [Streptosporangiaceae bacterium]